MHTLHLILYTMYHIITENGGAEQSSRTIFSSWWKSFTISRFSDNNNGNDDDDSHLIHTHTQIWPLTISHPRSHTHTH